jgi:hypothetical protein
MVAGASVLRLLTAMQRHLVDPRVQAGQESVCGALWALSYNEDHAAALMTAGALAHILAATERHLVDPRLQVWRAHLAPFGASRETPTTWRRS